MQKDLSDEELRLAKLVLIAILVLVFALCVTFVLGAITARVVEHSIVCSIHR